MTKTSLDKDKIKILLLEGIHSSAAEKFQADGYSQYRVPPEGPAPGGTESAAADAYFVGIRSATQAQARVFRKRLAADRRRLLLHRHQSGGSGGGQERGIPVFNAPFSNTRSVAELVLAETILLLRGIPHAQCRSASRRMAEDRHRVARSARQDAGHRRLRPYRHAGGRAGRIARHAGGLPRYRDQAGARQRPAAASLDALLEVADVVTLHVPETPQTLST